MRADRRERALVIGGLGVTQILAWGASFYLLAVLARPISSATGWSLTWVVSGVSLGLLIAGLVSPRVGRLIQDLGGRPVLAGSSAILAAGLTVLALSETLAAYFLGWMIIGLGMGAGLYDAAFAMLGRLYGEDARGAITALTLIAGFSSTICWPLSAFLVEEVGWRGTCFVYSALLLAIALPLHLLLLPRRVDPAPPATSNEQTGTSPSQRTVADEAGRRRTFILIAAAMTLSGVITSIMSVHIITILQSAGMAVGTAVALAALLGPSQVAGRLVEMAFGRHYHPIWTLQASVLLICLGLALVLLGIPVLALAVAAYGAGVGINWIVRGTLPLALFGPERYAAIMGRLALPSLLALAISPTLGGVLLEHAGARTTVLVLLGLAAANVAVAITLVRSVR